MPIPEDLGERFGVAASFDLAALVLEASLSGASPAEATGAARPPTAADGRAIIPVVGELCDRGARIGAARA